MPEEEPVNKECTITVVQPSEPEPEPEPEPEQNNSSSNSNSNANDNSSSNTPEMSFTNASYTGECSGDGINVRSGPSTDTSAVGTLSKGETVNVIETNTTTNTTTEQGATTEAANIIVSSNSVNTPAKDIGDNLGIKSLEIVEIPKFKEQFDWQNHDYTLQVQNMDKLTFKVVANPDGAQYEIIGNNGFVDGENVITITVKSKDGKDKSVYQITVIKTAGDNSKKSSVDGLTKGLIIVGVIVGVLILALIIVFIVRRRKEKQYEEEINRGNEDLERANNRKKKNFDEDGNYIGKEENNIEDEESEEDLEKTADIDIDKTEDFKEENKKDNKEENKEEEIENKENEAKKEKLDELLSNEEKKVSNKSIDDYLNEYRKKTQIKKPEEDVEKDLTKGDLLDEEIDKHINKDKLQDTNKIDKYELEVKEERFKNLEKDDYEPQEDDYLEENDYLEEDDEILSKLDKLDDDFEDDINDDFSIDGKIDEIEDEIENEIEKEEKIELDFNKKNDDDIFGRKNKGKHGY